MAKGRPSGTWTEEQREAARAWWDAERKLALALKRKAKPLGTRSKAWWAAHPEAAMEAGRRLNGPTPTLEEAFEMAERMRARWRDRSW